MIVNPDKFQSIIVDRKGQENNPIELKIGGKTIKSENSVNLLGLEIDSTLNFEKHNLVYAIKALVNETHWVD